MGDDDAALAVSVYIRRLLAGISAMVAAAEGVDALVFSGASASARLGSDNVPQPASDSST